MQIRQRFDTWPLKIVALPEATCGQVETVARAVEGEDERLPLVIFNTDGAFEDDPRGILAKSLS